MFVTRQDLLMGILKKLIYSIFHGQFSKTIILVYYISQAYLCYANIQIAKKLAPILDFIMA